MISGEGSGAGVVELTQDATGNDDDIPGSFCGDILDVSESKRRFLRLPILLKKSETTRFSSELSWLQVHSATTHLLIDFSTSTSNVFDLSNGI